MQGEGISGSCYSGITRAKKILVIVGAKKALSYAIRNVTVEKRNTMLRERLRKIGNGSIITAIVTDGTGK